MVRENDEAVRSAYWVLWGLAIASGMYLALPLFSAPPIGPDDSLHIENKDYEKVNLEEEPFIHGANFGEWPDPDEDPIREFEETTGHDLHVVGIFVNWTMPFEYVQPNATYIATHGAAPMITWAPHLHTTPEIIDGSKTLHQADGETRTLDEHIESWAEGICELAMVSEQPVLMRPMHEMNGGWFTWGISYRGHDGAYPNSDESFQEAWIKIHDTFRDHCSQEHVKFLWTMNHASTGEGTTYMGAYPGDKYVDYVGMDGYNWGGHTPWGWSTFDDLFGDVYCAITAQTDVPVLLPEWGSAEKGGDKAEWLRGSFDRIRSGEYGQIVGSMYFHVDKHERESDSYVEWGVDSSDEALAAYKTSLQALNKEGIDPNGSAICEA